MTFLSLIVASVSFMKYGFNPVSQSTKQLILLMLLCLVVAYLHLALTGQIFNSSEGTGLLELRAFGNFIIF